MSIYDKVSYSQVDYLKFKDLEKGDLFILGKEQGFTPRPIYECLGRSATSRIIQFKEIFNDYVDGRDPEFQNDKVWTVKVWIEQFKRKRFFREVKVGEYFNISLSENESALGHRKNYWSGSQAKVMKIEKTKLPKREEGLVSLEGINHDIDYINCILFRSEFDMKKMENVYTLDGYYLKDDDEVLIDEQEI